MSSSGRGVDGLASASDGTNYGGYFRSKSTSGSGVYAWASADSGTNYAVRGYTSSSDGYAAYFMVRSYRMRRWGQLVPPSTQDAAGGSEPTGGSESFGVVAPDDEDAA